MDREGSVHHGVNLQFAGRRSRIDFVDLVDKTIVVYGQQEVVKDLYAARLDAGGGIVFEAAATNLTDLESPQPNLAHRARVMATATPHTQALRAACLLHNRSSRPLLARWRAQPTNFVFHPFCEVLT
jgi:hypothetical protein